MELYESSVFTKLLHNYLSDREYRILQNFLIISPESGDLISGTGGFRKIRWSDPKRKKGKRGGLRIIYYYFNSFDQIWLLTIYDKNEAADLSALEKKSLKAAIEREIDEKTKSKVKQFKPRRS